MDQNDITGDRLVSKSSNKVYRENYDLIYNKREDNSPLGRAKRREALQNVKQPSLCPDDLGEGC